MGPIIIVCIFDKTLGGVLRPSWRVMGRFAVSAVPRLSGCAMPTSAASVSTAPCDEELIARLTEDLIIKINLMKAQ